MKTEALADFRRQMRRLERAVGGVFSDDVLCCGVSTAQCHVLLAIAEKGETGAGILAAELELDKSTLSRTIDGLVRSGLISRETRSDNRRTQSLRLTVAGQKKAMAINSQWDRYYQAIFSRAPHAQQEQITAGISYLIDAIAANRGCCRPQAPKTRAAQRQEKKGKNEK